MRELNGKSIKRPPLVERMKKRIRQIPEISLVDMNIPFTNGKNPPKSKDILEKEVDEKYYLRKEIVEKIVKESGFEERLISLKTPYQRAPLFNEDGSPAKLPEPNVGSDISYCVDANYNKGTNTEGDLNIVRINDPVHSNNRIYSDEGISPSLNNMEGGNRQPFLYEDQTTVAYSKSTRESHIDHRGKVDGEANTISTGDGGGNQSTQNFVVQYNRNNDLGKEIDVAATINSSDWIGLNRNQIQNAVLECLTPRAKYKRENVYSDDGIGPCLQAHQGGTAGSCALTTSKDEPYRIRKLTPVECNRLQGWNDTSLTLNFSLCLDQAKNFVNAVDRNPKLQKYANDVFQQELQKLAPVVNSLLRNHQATTSLAVENANIKTTLAENKLLTKLNIRVNNVEKNVLLELPKLEDFAVESAGTNTIGVAISLTGRVGTPLQDKNMMPVYNGKSAVNISGEEITILAEDVQNIAKIKSDTFTTLNHLDKDYTTLSLAILYCYVKTVMLGSTLEQTSIKTILLTMEYTKSLNEFGRKDDGTVYRMTNTQRYKQAGNGVSAPVPAFILSKLIPKEEQISIFSLFSGVAGTEHNLDKEQFKTVAFCEFDKYASDVLRYNHPEIRNYHDVTKVLENSDEKLPKCNMITGGFSCFLAGTLITTRRGLVPIEEVVKGDMVLTHTGGWRKVLTTMRRASDKYYKFQGMGFKTKVTGEHPYFVRNRTKVWNNDRRAYDWKYSEPFWKNVEDIGRGDYLAINIEEPNSNPYTFEDLPTDNETFWWIVGRYLADGWLRNRKDRAKDRGGYLYPMICCGKHETDEVEPRFNELFNPTKFENRTVYNYVFCSDPFGRFCSHFGYKANGKFIPDFVFDLPINFQKALIEGYVSGDGYKQDKEHYRITTTSYRLAMGISRLAVNVYKLPTSIVHDKMKKTKIIEGRKVNQRDFYRVSITTNRPNSVRYLVESDKIWVPFHKKVVVSEDVMIYNIEVEGDNSYCANNTVVHNCQPWSSAGLRQGFNDEKGRGDVVFHMLKVIEKLKPKYTLFENVKGLLTFDSGNAFVEICRSLSELGYEFDFEILNSKHFGLAQNRERVFIVGRLKEP